MKRCYRAGIWRFAMLCLAGPICSLHAETTNLVASADTRLTTRPADANEGSNSTFVAGTQGVMAGFAHNRALLNFDVAGRIPAGSRVTSARLSLTVTISPNTTDFEFDLRRVLKPWVEKEATWLIRLAPDVAWDTPGGGIGTDFSATISGSSIIGGVNLSTPYVFVSTSNLVADVQNWLDNPGTNFGWVLMTSNEEASFSARRFAARENTAASPPRLEVQYTSPAPSPRIDLVERVNETVRLRFTVAATFCYDLEFRDSLPGNFWATLTNICAPAAAQEVVITDSLSASAQRFYRLAITGQAP